MPLTERLAARLGLPGSDPRTSACRTDKADHAAGARTRRGAAPRDDPGGQPAPAALAAAEAVGLAGGGQAPVVGQQCRRQRLPHPGRRVAAAWAAIAGQRGALGEITRVVAVQEYLAGQKWTADTVTVSVPGAARPVHVITSLWRERVIVIGGHVAWGESWLVPPAAIGQDEAASEVAAYARRCWTRPGSVAGPACTEIVLTARGPRLVEVMARLAGCYPVHLVELVTGQNQVTSTVDALADPQALAAPGPAARGGWAVAQAWLLAPHAGFLDGASLEKIRALPSVRAALPAWRPEAAVARPPTPQQPRPPGPARLSRVRSSRTSRPSGPWSKACTGGADDRPAHDRVGHRVT